MDAPVNAPTPQLSSELQSLLDGTLRVEDFVATVVHEAAQPLTAIQILAAAIRTNLDMPLAERSKLLQDIEDQAKFLQDLATWMLKPFSREVVPFDVLLAGAADRARSAAPQHTIVTELDGGDAIVVAERVRVEASIRNLVKNSAAHSPDGSEITIASSVESKYAVITVSDHGVGIPESEWQRIFRPYTKVEAETSQWSGLGLFIVGSCAAQHDGFARVLKSDPQGTSIQFALSIGEVS